MSRVDVVSVSKTFPGRDHVRALDDFSVRIEEGELLALLGPSGCGKTTLLRSVAGLETPDSGTIQLGATSVFDPANAVDVPTNRRSIGMVFQSYALWPHLTVEKNIRYPLRARRIDRAAWTEWTTTILEAVGCAELRDRYPAQLSGGQQQRVALARALVARPAVVLFDEPMSNLDARLREQVRSELSELHARLGFTGIYVTHDHAEAIAVGDRVAVMRSGVIEQLGTPRDVFEEPQSEYVADFVGFVNRWTIDADSRADGPYAARGIDRALLTMHGSLTARFRREDAVVVASSSPARPGTIMFDGLAVASAVYAGRHRAVSLRAGDTTLHAEMADSAVDERLLDLDTPVSLAVPLACTRFFTADGVRSDVWADRGDVAAVAGRSAR